MNKNVKLIILIIVFASVFVGAYLLYNSLSAQVPDTLTPAAPDGSDTQTDKTDEAAKPEKEPENGTEAPTADETNGNAEPQRPLAPDFTVYDIDGNPVKLSDFRGKPVVLNFWASWCGPCRSEMPLFEETYRKYGEEVNIVTVNLTGGRETVESASKFIAEAGYTFPVYYDTSAEAAMKYGVTSIPATYFIDAEGYGIVRANGVINADGMAQGLKLLNK